MDLPGKRPQKKDQRQFQCSLKCTVYLYTFPENPETNIAPKKGLLQSNHWFSGNMLVAGSVLTFLGWTKILWESLVGATIYPTDPPSRCNNIWGDDFALWSLEFLQRKKVLGGHTEPCPRVPWWWPFRGDPPHRCWAGGRVDDDGVAGPFFFLVFWGVWGNWDIYLNKKYQKDGVCKNLGRGRDWMDAAL